MTTHLVLHGIGVSAGTAAAPAAIVQPAPGVDASEPGSVDAAADGARVREALAAVSERLSERVERAPEETKAVLKATAQLAGDRGLAKAIDKKLKKGLGLTQAVHDAVEDYAQMLRGLGGYMAERATDLYDVRDRVICELRGLPEPGVPAFDGPVVLVARDLAPAETATLDPKTVLGIITEIGGPTSHTAILAAQLGIPAIVKAEGILQVEEGTMLAIDGGVGEVIIGRVGVLSPWRDRPAREPPTTATASSCWPTSARSTTPSTRRPSILRGRGCSARSSSSWSAPRRRRWRNRPRRTRRFSGPSGRVASSCAPWMPGRTSLSPSRIWAPRRTPRWGVEACACARCVRI